MEERKSKWIASWNGLIIPNEIVSDRRWEDGQGPKPLSLGLLSRVTLQATGTEGVAEKTAGF